MSHVAFPAPPHRRPVWAVLAFAVALAGGWLSRRDWSRAMMGRRGMGSMMGDGGPASTTPLLVFAVLALVLAATVWLSSAAPRAAYAGALVATTLYLAAGGPAPTAVIAPAFTLAVLLRRLPAGQALAWLVLLLPAFGSLALKDPAGFAADPLPVLSAVLFAVAWVVLPASVAASVGSRRAAVAERRTDELRRVAYEERLRLARDIHDVVGHSLSMISLQSGVALHVLDSDPAQVRASLEAIRDASKSSLAELRQALGVFRQPDEGGPLVPTPSLAGLPGLVESVRAGGRTVGLVVAPGAADGVPAAVQAVAFRVVQEGLTNAVRHAPAASAAVSVERRPGELVVTVRDDGPASAPPAEGNGLRGMRERVAAVGGRLSIGVRNGGGLAVEATLPLAAGVDGGDHG